MTQYAGKAEELWEKYANDFGNIAMNRDDFLAALAEYAKFYGEMVRNEDAEIATGATAHTAYQSKECYRFSSYIAAAISNKELPELP